MYTERQKTKFKAERCELLVSVILTRLGVGTGQFKYLYGRGCLNGLKVINCLHCRLGKVYSEANLRMLTAFKSE